MPPDVLCGVPEELLLDAEKLSACVELTVEEVSSADISPISATLTVRCSAFSAQPPSIHTTNPSDSTVMNLFFIILSPNIFYLSVGYFYSHINYTTFLIFRQ